MDPGLIMNFQIISKNLNGFQNINFILSKLREGETTDENYIKDKN